MVNFFEECGAVAAYNKAAVFAIQRHGTQVRKYTGEPYWFHLRAVSSGLINLKGYEASQELIQAAWLHDVLEDTDTEPSEVEREFGSLVLSFVEAMTDYPDPTLNRAKRKEKSRIRLAGSPPEVQTLKCLDLLDNTPSIVRYDPKFSLVYLTEARELLDVLVNAHPKAWNMANNAIEEFRL